METIQTSAPVVEVEELSAEEGRALFDRRVREDMGISGDDYLAQYDRGELDYTSEAAVGLLPLIPFARRTP